MLKTVSAIILSLALWAKAQAPAAPLTQSPPVNVVHGFTTLSALAGAVTLVFPFNAPTNQLLTPTFVWRKSAEAESYELEISAQSDFSTVERSLTGLIDTLYALTGDLKPSTTYYWRVRGRNAGGAFPYSDVWSFPTIPPPPNPPLLIGTAGGAEWLEIPVSLSWHKSALAIRYQLQISLDFNFQTKVLDTTFSNGDTALVFGRLAYASTYYWRLSAGNQGGRSAFTQAESFTTLKKPVYVSLVAPFAGATNLPSTVILVWKTTPLAATYKVQIATDINFSTLVRDTSVSDTLLLARLDNKTRYYWRVSASNSAGSSPFADGHDFTTVDLFAPAVPVLVSPADSADEQSNSPALKWHPTDLAVVYKVQVSLSPTFGTLAYQDSAKDTSETVGPLKDGQRYYWRVQALNAAGVSGFSQIRSFRTGSVVAMHSRTGPVHESVSLVSGASGAVLEFSVQKPEFVRISLIEPGTGRTRELVNGKYSAGTYRLSSVNLACAAGVHVLRISLGSFQEVRWVARPERLFGR